MVTATPNNQINGKQLPTTENSQQNYTSENLSLDNDDNLDIMDNLDAETLNTINQILRHSH